MNCQCPGPCAEHPVKMTMLGPAVNVNPFDPLVTSCEIESLRKKLDEALAWKHLMTIQLTSSEREKANLKLQNEEMRHLVDAAVALYHDSAGHHEEAAWNEFVSQVRAYEIGKKEKRNDETFQGRNNDDGIMG